MLPDPPQRFHQDLVFAPISWLLPCVGTLQAFSFQPFAPLFSAISHLRHRHRLPLYSRSRKIRFKNDANRSAKRPVFVISVANILQDMNSGVVFGSFKLNPLELFSVFHTLCLCLIFPAVVSDIWTWKAYFSISMALGCGISVTFAKGILKKLILDLEFLETEQQRQQHQLLLHHTESKNTLD